MEQLQIKTGKISVKILDDDGEVRGIFKFNPEDIKSARKVNDLIDEFKVKTVEFQEKIEQAVEVADRIKLLDEIVDYFRNAIDSVWGSGSSNILFGNASTLEMFDDFFNGITPFYKKESAKRTQKYTK